MSRDSERYAELLTEFYRLENDLSELSIAIGVDNITLRKTANDYPHYVREGVSAILLAQVSVLTEARDIDINRYKSAEVLDFNYHKLLLNEKTRIKYKGNTGDKKV